ncbi:hypothetical protein [Escherichia phage pEC-M719-6WT.1]|uniref:Uncharacterized protein n=1 Tax=Escherichia phage pEC-M719-6WT.1 TaxID=3056220 RepID=A0AA51YF71_9CAUD|nr:hypothetical protein [Escherichia phage pEC-M719-6WT.1]
MTARLKLTDTYLKEGFTPFYEETNSVKFKKECLTRIDDFCKVLINKGHTVELEYRELESVLDGILVSVDNDTGYMFRLTDKTFEYEIYRRVV